MKMVPYLMEVNNMSDDYSKYPETSGFTDSKGKTHEVETYDRGSYTETITRVTSPNGAVNTFVDKNAKK